MHACTIIHCDEDYVILVINDGSDWLPYSKATLLSFIQNVSKIMHLKWNKDGSLQGDKIKTSGYYN